ncbi:MAG: ComF family protein [Erythrobacter sp.]
MNVGSHLAEALRPLVDLVYPPRCPLCGIALAEQGGLCSECWCGLEFPGEPCCVTCQRPMSPKSQAGRPQCRTCIAHPPLHSRVTAATLYNDTSRRLVLDLKHGHKIALAGLMGRLMAGRLDYPGPGEPAPLLVPVPLHRWRLWNRGFNQAGLLAREIAKAGKGEVLVDALVRRQSTPSLGGLGRAARERALAGAIQPSPHRREALRGRRVILVDDVLTSGATTRACVAALLDAGAAQVEIACFARVDEWHNDAEPESQRPRP